MAPLLLKSQKLTLFSKLCESDWATTLVLYNPNLVQTIMFHNPRPVKIEMLPNKKRLHVS